MSFDTLKREPIRGIDRIIETPPQPTELVKAAQHLCRRTADTRFRFWHCQIPKRW